MHSYAFNSMQQFIILLLIYTEFPAACFIGEAYRVQTIITSEMHIHTLSHTTADAHFTVDRRCWSAVQPV